MSLSTRALRALPRASARSFATNIGPSANLQQNVERLEQKGMPMGKHVGMHNLDAAPKLDKCPFLANNDILMRVAQRESNARTYVRRFPFVIKKAQGIMLTDTEGRQWYDCLGVAGTLALGHNHPVINDAIRKFLESGAPAQVLDMATPEKDQFVTDLQSVLPADMRDNARFHFCSPAGTDALDAAVKLCKHATGRRSVLAFHGGYHGHGHGTLAMMGNLDAKSSIAGLMSDVHFLPYPYTFRNPFGMDSEEGERAVLRYIETVLNDVESGIPKPACMVVEAIQGEGGVGSLSDFALQELRRLTLKYDVPLVLDEVQAGFCRSGDFFAFQKSGIAPDVVCMSKAVGGSQPLAVLAYNKRLDKWGPGAHTGTFRGSQLSFVCGSASINYMKEVKLWEHATARGAQLRKHLADLASRSKSIVDIRGRGMMLGVELAKPDTQDHTGRPQPFGDLAQQVQMECVKRGMILERGGRGGAVMRILAPLVITEKEVDTCAGIFADALLAAEKKLL